MSSSFIWLGIVRYWYTQSTTFGESDQHIESDLLSLPGKDILGSFGIFSENSLLFSSCQDSKQIVRSC